MSIGDRPTDWETTARDWQRHAEQLRDQRNAAREEIARLREALILARKEISDHDNDYHHRTRDSTAEAIRAALACRPQGEKS